MVKMDEDVRKITCCFSGHRDIPESDRRKIRLSLEKTIDSLIDAGYVYFGCGGAVGFDTMAAEAVIEAKKKNADIKLILVIPCENQSRYWEPEQIEKYEKIMKSADKVKVLSKTYYNGCMQARNKHLVDHSSACVTYLRRDSGGTFFTANYAIRKKLKMINI